MNEDIFCLFHYVWMYALAELEPVVAVLILDDRPSGALRSYCLAGETLVYTHTLKDVSGTLKIC